MSRARYYKLAVISSLASKLGTILLQLVLTPIAAMALGPEGFALYVILIAASGWLGIASLGLGPVMSVQVAYNTVNGTLGRERVIIASAFWTTFGFGLIATVFSISFVAMLPVSQVFGQQFQHRTDEVIAGFFVMTGAYFWQLNLSIFEAAHAGLQRQYTTNLVMAVGALASLPAAFAASCWWPTPVGILMAGSVPTLVLRSGHVLALMSRRRSIRPNWQAFDFQTAKSLLSKGAMYALAGSAGNFMSHSLPIILVGRTLSAQQTGAFASTLQLITLLSGVTTMLVSPAVPSIANSIAEREYVWVQKIYRSLLLGGLSFSIVAASILILAGDWIFNIWLRGAVNPEKNLLLYAGIYFVLSTWEVLHFSLLVSMQKSTIASLLVFFRAMVGTILTYVLMSGGGEETPFLAMCLAILIIDLVPLHLLVRKELRNGVEFKNKL